VEQLPLHPQHLALLPDLVLDGLHLGVGRRCGLAQRLGGRRCRRRRLRPGLGRVALDCLEKRRLGSQEALVLVDDFAQLGGRRGRGQRRGRGIRLRVVLLRGVCVVLAALTRMVLGDSGVSAFTLGRNKISVGIALREESL